MVRVKFLPFAGTSANLSPLEGWHLGKTIIGILLVARASNARWAVVNRSVTVLMKTAAEALLLLV